MHEYAARLLKVVDGDTVDLHVDLGFGVYRVDRFRLTGIQASEMHLETGERAKHHLEALLDPVRDQLVVRTQKDKREKYGRYLAELVIPGGATANDLMLADGFAVAWDGKGRRPDGVPKTLDAASEGP